MLKFYLPVLIMEVSFYIYNRPLTGMNVIASVSALNLWIKCQYLLFKAVALTTKRNLSQFCFIIYSIADF